MIYASETVLLMSKFFSARENFLPQNDTTRNKPRCPEFRGSTVVVFISTGIPFCFPSIFFSLPEYREDMRVLRQEALQPPDSGYREAQERVAMLRESIEGEPDENQYEIPDIEGCIPASMKRRPLG